FSQHEELSGSDRGGHVGNLLHAIRYHEFFDFVKEGVKTEKKPEGDTVRQEHCAHATAWVGRG
ncbi:MAG: hypothetical protein AAB733_02075, partial [Patescibacteria group bacterium]